MLRSFSSSGRFSETIFTFTALLLKSSFIIRISFSLSSLSFIMDFISSPQALFILKISGSLILMAFGIYSFKSNPTKKIHKSGKKKGSLIYNMATAFGVTIFNPLIIFLFIASFAQFAFIRPNHPFEMGVGYFCIFLVALLWWFGLTWLIDQIRGKFDTSGILLINKIIGCIVIIFSAILSPIPDT